MLHALSPFAQEALRVADVCAGPGGFSEYILWRANENKCELYLCAFPFLPLPLLPSMTLLLTSSYRTPASSQRERSARNP